MIEAHNSIFNSLHWVIDQNSSGKIKKLSQEFFCTNCAIVTKSKKCYYCRYNKEYKASR